MTQQSIDEEEEEVEAAVVLVRRHCSPLWPKLEVNVYFFSLSLWLVLRER